MMKPIAVLVPMKTPMMTARIRPIQVIVMYCRLR